ncbi:hypothetical protein BCR35DRAFT_307264 [Leucosporidium creatinivorum]|uniref:Uncharacterized protein n=1 Tax=Leucosporidium creatinivorum TaxID=106004 RepID=A0A1Y2EQY3_9BASI|nr:hypothetical protein BCR35DRAFT_307264 [Leucosporidium creatinivorum]
MARSIDIATPLLPHSIQKMLNDWVTKDVSPWYQELEFIYSSFSPQSWQTLGQLVLSLKQDFRAIEQHVYYTGIIGKMTRHLTRNEKDEVELYYRLRAALEEVRYGGPYRLYERRVAFIHRRREEDPRLARLPYLEMREKVAKDVEPLPWPLKYDERLHFQALGIILEAREIPRYPADVPPLPPEFSAPSSPPSLRAAQRLPAESSLWRAMKDTLRLT